MTTQRRFLFLVLIMAVLSAIEVRAEDKIDYPEIENLVQQDKYSEAAAKLDALIKEYPHNQKLKDMRASLQASAPAAGVNPLGPLPITAPATQDTALDNMSRLKLDRIIVDGNEAQAQNDQDTRAKDWQTLLIDSDDFVKTNPNEFKVWLLRAAAALELDLSKPGWEAGKNLVRLGALKTSDQNIAAIMGYLDQKGWIVDDYASIDRKNAESRISDEISELKVKIGEDNDSIKSLENYAESIANGIRSEAALGLNVDYQRNQLSRTEQRIENVRQNLQEENETLATKKALLERFQTGKDQSPASVAVQK